MTFEKKDLLDNNLTVNGKFEVIVDFQKTADGETGKFLGFIEGYAATPDLDRELDIIEDSAFKDGAKQLRASPAVFFNHKHMELPEERKHQHCTFHSFLHFQKANQQLVVDLPR